MLRIYLYGVEGAFGKSGDRVRIMNYQVNNNIDFQIGIHAVYFKTEQDRLMFLLWYKSGE